MCKGSEKSRQSWKIKTKANGTSEIACWKSVLPTNKQKTCLVVFGLYKNILLSWIWRVYYLMQHLWGLGKGFGEQIVCSIKEYWLLNIRTCLTKNCCQEICFKEDGGRTLWLVVSTWERCTGVYWSKLACSKLCFSLYCPEYVHMPWQKGSLVK